MALPNINLLSSFPTEPNTSQVAPEIYREFLPWRLRGSWPAAVPGDPWLVLTNHSNPIFPTTMSNLQMSTWPSSSQWDQRYLLKASKSSPHFSESYGKSALAFLLEKNKSTCSPYCYWWPSKAHWSHQFVVRLIKWIAEWRNGKNLRPRLYHWAPESTNPEAHLPLDLQLYKLVNALVIETC